MRVWYIAFIGKYNGMDQSKQNDAAWHTATGEGKPMDVRARQEKLEFDLLSPHAVKSAQTRGRQHPAGEDHIRTEFQRDRDRILHSKSFRRLKQKTQMILSPQGDHYRTRLTHTMEVAQIARTLARALRMNEDLTEAIALGHDLGHTPFGHTGERSLNRLCSKGFKHREQSLRVVDLLENEGEGLNLTWEVRDGILHHSGGQRAATLEGSLVHMADRIAYINHDIDDAIRFGLLTMDRLPKEAIAVLGITHSQRINTLVCDAVDFSMDKPEPGMSPPVQQAMAQLRAFMFENVYSRSIDQAEEARADHVIVHLFQHYSQHPEDMAVEYQKQVADFGLEVAVCDCIAGMTDGYAANTYRRLFLPSPWW